MSVALREVIAGPPVRGRVLAVFPRAVYLDLDRPVAAGAPSLVSVVSADGIPHPNSAVLTRAGTARPFAACRTGASVSVGRGRIVIGAGAPGVPGRGTGPGGAAALELHATRWWPPRPTLVPVRAEALASRARRLRSLLHELVGDRAGIGDPATTGHPAGIRDPAGIGDLAGVGDPAAHGASTPTAQRADRRAGTARYPGDRIGPGDATTLDDPWWLMAAAERLVHALLVHDVRAAEAAGRALMGRGPGLTPAGDDVLCGLFATALLLRPVVFGAPQAGVASDTTLTVVAGPLVEAARERTTSVSAALLWYASRGHAAGPLADLLRTLAGGGALTDDLDRLIAVGSTSGRDLAIGVVAGLDLALATAAEPWLARTSPDTAPAAEPWLARTPAGAATAAEPWLAWTPADAATAAPDPMPGPDPMAASGTRAAHRPPTERPVTGAERR